MKLDHVSCVVLGHFNPAILTPRFLKDKCGFPADAKIDFTVPYSRLASQVACDGVTILVLPDRLQVNEQGIENTCNSKVIEYVKAYLDRLEFTPIAACGVNFNYTGFERHQDILKKSVRKSLQRLLDTEQLHWSLNAILDKDGDERIDAFGVKGIQPECIVQLDWKLKSGRLNINFEQRYGSVPVVPDTQLEEYSSSTKLLAFLSRFEELCDHCDKILKALGKG